MKNRSLRSMHLRKVVEDKRVFLVLLMVMKVWKRKIVRVMIRVCASGWRV